MSLFTAVRTDCADDKISAPRRIFTMDVYFARDGKILGLYPDDGVPQLLEGRAVVASDYYWHEGMSSWEPIASKWETLPSPPEAAHGRPD